MINIPENLPKEITDKYQVIRNSFITKDNGEKASELKVIVGDDKQDDFFPQVKIDRWSGETNFSVRLKHTEKNATIETDGDKIKWKGRKVEAHFYDVEKTDDLPKAFELEVLLLEKPKTNKVEFTTQSKGLKFYYQPELTQEERGDGCHRPENVIGSYAVYHESKAGDYSKMGLKNYRAGKAFHIYRPKIIDSAGTEVWGKLSITDNLLTVEIPQEFLDNAVYPVIVDPTFGESGDGVSNQTIQDRICGSQFTGASGTIDSISFRYNESPFADTIAKCGIYQHSNLSKVAQSEEINPLPTGTGWQIHNVTGSPSISAIDYVIAVWGDADVGQIFYDDGVGTTQGHYQSLDYGTNSGTFPSTMSATHEDRKYSIYCTYTAGGAAENKSKRLLRGIGI